MLVPWAAVLAAVCSACLCVALVVTRSWHGRWTLDADRGIQKFHTQPTPRIGGVPIWLGIGLGTFWAEASVQALLWPLYAAGTLAFGAGLMEDLTGRVSVSQRLLATLLAGWAVCWATGWSLSRVDVGGLDVLLCWGLFSILFTGWALAGVANSFNIIDGFNGLASGTALLCLMGLSTMAGVLGDGALVGVGLVVMGAVFGFFVVNWPLGKIFLGDGGAYGVGFASAWMAVLLLERHPNVSAFAVLLVFAHPVTEVMFSVYRRLRQRRSPGHPDRLHLHSLLKRRCVRRWWPWASPLARNSLAGALPWGLTAGAIVVGLWTQFSHWGAVVAVLSFVVIYATVYSRMVCHRWPWQRPRQPQGSWTANSADRLG